MKKYIVVEKTHKLGFISVLNTDTTSPDDPWHNMASMSSPSNMGQLKEKVLTFESKKEAEEYKKVSQKMYNKQWEKWGQHFKKMGYNKPKWVVEEFSNIFKPQNIQTI
jgi:hypothetical protein